MHKNEQTGVRFGGKRKFFLDTQSAQIVFSLELPKAAD